MEVATANDIVVSSSWKQTDKDFYTSNDVIEAYLAGKREGLNSEEGRFLISLTLT